MSTSTTPSSRTATVSAMYEAFGRGDLPAILARLAPDVTWDVVDEPWSPHAAGVPWLEPRRGRDAIPAFFAIVGDWTYERFEVLDVLVSDTQVAAELRMVAELPNGKRIDEVVIHLWRFDEQGRVVALRRVLDTAANIDAARA